MRGLRHLFQFIGAVKKTQAFLGGFWSVFEIRPFGEKPSFHPNGEPFDYKKLREELGYNENVWNRVGGYFDTVGGHLRNAMKTIDEEIANNDRNPHTRQDT
jgi:hypothetical protein